MRIGHGYDVHRLVEGRKLILGGVDIPHHKGLEGHSDADVLIHAICDACLGAAGLGDIGQHFPDDDPTYKDIDSRVLLRQVMDKLEKENLSIENIDSTIIAQAPKLVSYFPDMKRNISSDLRINIDQINIKATTTEGLGFVGKGEGIEIYAVALLSITSE